jgi:hypothetical protein
LAAIKTRGDGEVIRNARLINLGLKEIEKKV